MASQEEEVSWSTFELAVYMQFVFVTAISISTSETQGKLTQYQNHGKVIQRRAGGNNIKLLEKGMETPSSHVIDLLTSILATVLTAGKYTKKAVSQVPDNKNY